MPKKLDYHTDVDHIEFIRSTLYTVAL